MFLEFCETFLRIKYRRPDTFTEGKYAHRSIQSRLGAAERAGQTSQSDVVVKFVLQSMWQSFILSADSLLQSDL